MPSFAGGGARATLGTLFCCFLLDNNFQVRSDVFVEPDGHGEFAQGFEGLVNLDLPAIDVETLLGQGVRDVAGGYGAEELLLFSGDIADALTKKGFNIDRR